MALDVLMMVSSTMMSSKIPVGPEWFAQNVGTSVSINMSFIKNNSEIGYEEAQVLRFALQKTLPSLETVAKEATGERGEKATANVTAAKDMLADLEESLSESPKI